MPFAVYCACVASTPSFWDTGEAQTVPWIFGIMHPTGFPLFTMLAGIFAHAFPFGTVAWRIGIFSALATSVAASFVYRGARSCGAAPATACAGSWVFAFGSVVWMHATRAEVHTLALCFTAASLSFALRAIVEQRAIPLVAAAGLWGLALATHPVSSFLLPALLFAAFACRGALTARTIAAAFAVVMIALCAYLYLPLRSSAVAAQRLDPTLQLALPPGSRAFWDTNHPATAEGFVRELTGSEYFSHPMPAQKRRDALLPQFGVFWNTFVRQLTPAGVVLSLIGFVLLWRRNDLAAYAIAIAFVTPLCAIASGLSVPSPFSNVFIIEADAARYWLLQCAIAGMLCGAALTGLLQTFSWRWKNAAVALIVGTELVWVNRQMFDHRNSPEAAANIAAVVANTPDNAIIVTSWLNATALAYASYVDHTLGHRIVDTARLSTEAPRLRGWLRRYPVYALGDAIQDPGPAFVLRAVTTSPDIARVDVRR